ncbi:hypothetical protein RHSIM_Rhsim03G0005300 [Rhododendron simsii]|uniref:Uncharacterized protein n=1 Tax=Rhododendron simsii TaxID=118357 RepID=A0A834LQM9_RHOSS|nr:hypothetical protein RHSIM_Rhsim03G0005300 [Rhododendron simsii]
MTSLLTFTILPKSNRTKVACSSSSTATTLSPPEILTLDQKFGQKGIKFSDSSDVELIVRNGSSLKLRIPDGHVTSVTSTSTTTSATKAKGGIDLVINNVNASDPNSRPSHVITSKWPVELNCTSGTLYLSYVVSLYPLSMATTVIVKNNWGKAVNLTGAILEPFQV